MFRLTREVRFGIDPQGQVPPPPWTNGHAGAPPLCALGHFFTLRLTLAGQLDPVSNYLLNIKQLDHAVRQRALPLIAAHIQARTFSAGLGLLPELSATLASAFDRASLECLELSLTPFLTLSFHASEPSMVRLSQKFEFSASHRLFNPALSDEENRALFGKCSNPHGHGHNYELQVTLTGQADDRGLLIPIPQLERIVAQRIIERFDHKNLNVELPEFRDTIPSVENIAAVIYRLLKGQFAPATLKSVTVWETPKTWCEYSE